MEVAQRSRIDWIDLKNIIRDTSISVCLTNSARDTTSTANVPDIAACPSASAACVTAITARVATSAAHDATVAACVSEIAAWVATIAAHAAASAACSAASITAYAAAAA